MALFSTKEMAKATGMTVRQIQHYADKKVVRVKRRNTGRGFSLMFENNDIIRFMLILEMMKFGLNNEKMYNLISNFFRLTKEHQEISTYLKNKLYLKNRHFHLICEYPREGEHDEVYGYLIYDPNQPESPLPPCYFNQADKTDSALGFYGYKFENFSRSALFFDIADMYRERHKFLLKHSGSNDNVPLDDEIKIRTGIKGG